MTSQAQMQSTERFQGLAQDYRKFRPGYPAALYKWLLSKAAPDDKPIDWADIGAGTGIFANGLLDRGQRVLAVEPNADMRLAARAVLGHIPRIRFIDGTAEHTNLPDACVDAIVAAQAYHWFDRAAFRAECSRILRPGGWLFLVWNERAMDTSFNIAYEQFLRRTCPDYVELDVQHHLSEEDQLYLFGRKPIQASFPNAQKLDFKGLEGRVRSCSYVPKPDSPLYTALHAGMVELFETYQQGFHVSLHYHTLVYGGILV